jgi:hypothetical protein
MPAKWHRGSADRQGSDTLSDIRMFIPGFDHRNR